MALVARIEYEGNPRQGCWSSSVFKDWSDLPTPSCEGRVDMQDYHLCAVASPRQAKLWWGEASGLEDAHSEGLVCAVYEVEDHSTHFLPKQIVFDHRTATRVAVYPPIKMQDLEFIGSVLQASATEN